MDRISGPSSTVTSDANEDSFVDPELCAKSVTGYDIFLDGGMLESLGESTIIEIVNKEIKILRKGVISQDELLIHLISYQQLIEQIFFA